jgi:hypothetical protein
MKIRNLFAKVTDADLDEMRRLREDAFYRHLEFLREKFAHLLRSSQRRNENA